VAESENLPSGKTILKAHLPRRTRVLIFIDHMWLKRGYRAELLTAVKKSKKTVIVRSGAPKLIADAASV
jgi:hypothetical protein